MSNRFGLLLEILTEAFQAPVSEEDYYNIIAALRAYDTQRCTQKEEQTELKARGWPLTYHPCDNMERLRYAFVFAPEDNKKIGGLLKSGWSGSELRLPTAAVATRASSATES